MRDADVPILVGLILLISAVVGLLATGILGGSVFPHEPQGYGLRSISIDGTPLRVEVADTPDERTQGLSGRSRLPENQGMLFVFDEPGNYAIWMKDMQFPIDIFWVDESGTIIAMWEYAHPDSYPLARESEEEAQYIVEVTGGFAELYNVEIGDTISGLPE